MISWLVALALSVGVASKRAAAIEYGPVNGSRYNETVSSPVNSFVVKNVTEINGIDTLFKFANILFIKVEIRGDILYSIRRDIVMIANRFDLAIRESIPFPGNNGVVSTDDFNSYCCATIFYRNVQCYPGGPIRENARINLVFSRDEIGSRLYLSDAVRLVHGFRGQAGIGNSFLRKSDLPKQKGGAYRRDENASSANKKHPKGPFGHIPLGLKIAFAALTFASGLYYLCDTWANLGLNSSAGKTIAYTLFGVGGIMVGIGVSLDLILR